MSTKVDQLKVNVFINRDSLGRAAAEYTAELIKDFMAKQEKVRIVFAAAPSQDEFLAYLSENEDIDWKRITAFHMDEYVGLSNDHPAKFGRYLEHHIFKKVPIGEIHYMISDGNIEQACKVYGEMLKEAPIDIVCLGIGENGHIAFNDPGVADFHDSKIVKKVLLDEVCRMQQVHDGCFPNLAAVPREAITLTIPTLFSAKSMVCIVPGKTKRSAVKHTLYGPISEECPASILRQHSNSTLFVDQEAFGSPNDGIGSKKNGTHQ